MTAPNRAGLRSERRAGVGEVQLALATRGFGMRRLIRLAAAAAIVAAQALVPANTAAQAPTTPTTPTTQNCTLSNGIKHVIYMQFDNTHLFRDRPGVPSDLEQMPNLLN